MKEILDNAKKNAIAWFTMLTIGFGLGKLITYNNIIADCEVLGMFRIGDYGAQCRISKVSAKEYQK
jgi:hypothetical protein